MSQGPKKEDEAKKENERTELKDLPLSDEDLEKITGGVAANPSPGLDPYDSSSAYRA